MSVYVVTGAAGFIGSVLAGLMLREGHTVFGIDNLNHVYDVRVKEHRLQALLPQVNFHFIRDDIADRDFIGRLAAMVPSADAVVNLAAIAGVRASTTDPLELPRHQHPWQSEYA
jgi:Nucleoside-diphosphate-sugar epimerases